MLAGLAPFWASTPLRSVAGCWARSRRRRAPPCPVLFVYDEFENPSSTWNTTGDQFGGNAQYDNLGFLTTFLQYDAKAGDGSSTSNTTGTNNVYFGWDAATGRLNGQWTTNNTRGTISDLGKTTYTYSASGKLTARELAFSSRPGVASDYQCYDYDYASRLEAVWTPASKSCTTAPTTASTTVAGLGGPAAYAQTYGYTAAGDRSQVKRFDATGALAVTEQYNYSAPGTAGPHQVDSIVSTPGAGGAATTQTFTWDAAGKMTGRAGQSLTYTPDGLLATTTGTTVPANPNPGAANGTPAGPTTGAGSLGTRYYDAAGNLVGIVDGTGTTVTLGSVTAHSTPGGVKTATCTYNFAGKTVAQRTAAAGVVKLSFIIGDSVNTAQTMTQPTTGASPITAIQRYTDPYGLARSANLTGTGNNAYTAAGAGTAGVGSNAANPNGFSAANGFIAGLNDTVSSLTHLGARDYDPVTGAFTTPDPVLHTDQSEGFTPYSYAWGDPINRADPSGLDPGADIIFLGGIALVGALSAALTNIKWPTFTFTMPPFRWPWEHSSDSSAAAPSAPAARGTFDYSAYHSVGGVTVSRPAVQPIAGGIGGGYVAASLGGTKFSTPAVRQGGNTFTSPAVRQGGQSTGDTRGADTGAALAAQNAVMHAASVEATASLGRAAQAEAAARSAATSVASAGQLRAQLAGQEIASGHAFDKHVVQQGEYPNVRTRAQFAGLIEEVILKGESKSLGLGRTAYWYDGTFVVRNPKDPDGGSAYRETLDYFKRQR